MPNMGELRFGIARRDAGARKHTANQKRIHIAGAFWFQAFAAVH